MGSSLAGSLMGTQLRRLHRRETISSCPVGPREDSVISLSKVSGKQPSQDENSDLGIGSASHEAIFRKVAREKMSRSLRRQVGISSLVYCLVLIFKIA